MLGRGLFRRMVVQTDRDERRRKPPFLEQDSDAALVADRSKIGLEAADLQGRVGGTRLEHGFDTARVDLQLNGDTEVVQQPRDERLRGEGAMLDLGQAFRRRRGRQAVMHDGLHVDDRGLFTARQGAVEARRRGDAAHRVEAEHEQRPVDGRDGPCLAIIRGIRDSQDAGIHRRFLIDQARDFGCADRGIAQGREQARPGSRSGAENAERPRGFEHLGRLDRARSRLRCAHPPGYRRGCRAAV